MKKIMSVIAVAAVVLTTVFGLDTTTVADDIIATIDGTIASGSTSSILKVNTTEGTYEIKLDSGTQYTGSKILLPGRNVSVSLKHGDDAYLHAVTVKDSGTSGVSVDRSNTSEVTGTIKDVDSKNVIYFEISNGEMQVKLDETTDLSGTTFLMAGNKYTMKVARGSDAYMHAVSIYDAGGSSYSSGNYVSSTGSSYSYSTATLSGDTYSCTGTVSSSTKPDVLYLNCSDGERALKLDMNTDTSHGYVLIPGMRLSVSYRYGSDAYWHAVEVSGETAGKTGASVKDSDPTTVVGTVSSKTTPDILNLEVSNGTMEIKLDSLSSLDGIKAITSGQKITVKIGYGSDAYWHALSISG
ncbi:MAG: hypothetical protein K6A38_02795 [Lachnospiraceae bacterium]|nr:hypothetical protein [Lachnospiraceae bacterium]